MKINGEAAKDISHLFGMVPSESPAVTYTETLDHCVVVVKTAKPKATVKLIQFCGGATRIVRKEHGKRIRLTVDAKDNISVIPGPQQPFINPQVVTIEVHVRAKDILCAVREAMLPLEPKAPINPHLKLLPRQERKP